jgi:F-type H+-transporting ATPase subunit a
MVIEVGVAIILFLLFTWLAKKIVGGGAPKGKAWNFFESFLTFIKTDIVEKGIEPPESKKFMPLFWTLFLFILGCNLAGMIPWVGSPTAALALTAVLALVVFLVGAFVGIKKFGVVGYLKNLCPHLGLPTYLAIFIVPMVWFIEFASLFIKHTILAIRLLANMVAGHLVLLGIMGLAFGTHAASMHVGSWSALSVIAILGTTVLSFMELFVAFLQAYVFTLLAALFIGSATHHH